MITVAPLIAYYSQYSLICETKSVGSFSIDMCGILIVANVLKVCFWFLNGYAINLLFQSILVLMMQFLLIYICIKVGYRKKEDVETGVREFWRWEKI